MPFGSVGFLGVRLTCNNLDLDTEPLAVMLFPQKTEVNHNKVGQLLERHWGLKLGPCIKASQNHTFKVMKDNVTFILRVTPDPSNQSCQRIEDELTFVRFLKSEGLSTCGPIPTLEGLLLLRVDDLTLCVFECAKGKAVSSLEWLQQDYASALGRWLAKFHVLSKKFMNQHPEVASRFRRWNELHDGVLKEIAAEEVDTELMGNEKHWGLLHGDVNPSNWFFDAASSDLCVFDWDQVQQGWWLMDLAQAIWAAFLLKWAGKPVDGSAIPGCDPHQYLEWVTQSYESAGGATVDRDRLRRMLTIRKEFYERFCRRALVEGVPDDMKPFIEYVVAFFDRPNVSELSFEPPSLD